MMFTKMVLLSIQRRKKEMRFVSIVTFIAVLFLATVSLFQNVMNRYLMETNYKNYGEWMVSSIENELAHPYFAAAGSCDTGAVVLNPQDAATGESVGSVDEGFLALANLTFYEGRMPEQNNEIVMNLTTLAKLGYSMDLGQTIHIRVQTENGVLEQDFTLVGTIRDFSNTWKYVNGKPLPSCLITEEAVADLGGVLYTTHFYQLDRTYENINFEEMVDAFAAPGEVEFNSYVYENTIWGSEESFHAMQEILVLIAVLVLSYLMMSYVSKRRNWYYKLRCTGAGKLQIWAMIFIEGLYGTVPWAVAGFVLPYLAAVPLCGMVSQKQQLPNIYVVDGQGVVSQVLITAGVILLVLVVACLGTSDKRLSNNVSEVTKGQLRRLKRAARRTPNTARHFLKRQDIRSPLQKAVMILCSIAVSAILVSCIHVVIWKYEDYRLITESRSDFDAYKYLKEDVSYTYLVEDEFGNVSEEKRIVTTNSFYNQIDAGVDAQMEKELAAIEGIKQIEMEISETDSYLDWEGKENSHVYLFTHALAQEQDFVNEEERQRYVESQVSKTFTIDTYEDLLENYGAVLKMAQIEEEAFVKGEQVIVILRSGHEESYMNELGEITEGIIIEETTLKDGGTAIWKSYRTDVEVPVKVKVLSLTDEEWDEMDIGLRGDYEMFASIGFAERIAEAKGTQVQYNQLQIDFEPNTSFGSTTKRLAALLGKNGFEYNTNWELKDMAWDEFVSSLCIYGTLFCMISAVYLVLQMNVNQMKNHDRTRQYRLLKRLGMSDSFFIRMTVKQGIKDALWLFSGVVSGYVVYAVVEYQAFFNEYGTVGFTSSFTGESTNEAFWWVMENMLANLSAIHFICTIGFVVILILLISVIVGSSVGKSMLKEEKIS